MKTVNNWFRNNPDWKSKIFIERYLKTTGCNVIWDSNQYSKFDGYIDYNNKRIPLELKVRDLYSFSYKETLIDYKKYINLVNDKGILIVIFKDCFIIFKDVKSAFSNSHFIYCRSTTSFDGYYGNFKKCYLNIDKGKKVNIDTTFCYTGEIWKKIKGYDYEVSTNGNVRNKFGKLLKPHYIKGYYNVCLYSNKVRKEFMVHRLVADTFIGINSELEVNHINENKLDNRIENLEWCDREYNMNYGTRSKKVSQYNLDGCFIRQYPGAGYAAREVGCSATTIKDACRGRFGHNKAIGYIWKYEQ